MDREALREAIRVVIRAAWSFAAAFAAALVTYALTDDPAASIVGACLAWLGTFAWLIWKLL